MLMAKKAKGFKLREMRKKRAQEEREQARASARERWISCSACPNSCCIVQLSGLSDECRRKCFQARDNTAPNPHRTYKVVDSEGKEVCA